MTRRSSIAAALLLAAGLFAGQAHAQTATTAAPATGSATPSVTGPKAATPSSSSASTSSSRRSSASASKLDINTASADDLGALPGMTPAYAQAVIAGRPYRAKTELTRKKILPQTVYAGVRDKIVAHRPKA